MINLKTAAPFANAAFAQNDDLLAAPQRVHHNCPFFKCRPHSLKIARSCARDNDWKLTHGGVSSILALDMPTNLKLDDKLIADAVKLGKHKTKQEAVNSALEEYVAHRNQLKILELEGKIRFHPDWDYKKLRRK